MDAAYPRIAARLFGQAHAIEPEALRTLLDGPVARRILSGERPKRGLKQSQTRRTRHLSARIDAEPVAVGEELGEFCLTSDGVAIVPVYGVLSRRFDWLTAFCGWTTYEGLAATFEAMLADSRVRAILMDVESPGGEAGGMLDIADAIIAARASKPVWAVANDYAASAAYAIAGSASRLVLPRLAQVGSIGAVIVHVDESTADAGMGLKYTAIYSGARKIDGWGHAPISPQARDVAQANVDHCRNEFAGLIARQGRMSAKQALATEAALFSDDGAVGARLADAVATFDEALAEISDLAAGRPRTSATAAATAVIEPGAPAMTTKPAEAGQEQAATAATPAATTSALQPAAEAPKGAGKAKPNPESAHESDPGDGKEKKLEGDVAAYTATMADETLELCTLAGASLAEARAFISAKTPIAQVRATLAAKRAKASDAVELSATPAKTQSATAGWDEAIDKVNARFGHAKKA